MNRSICLSLILVASLTACEFDNYPTPESVLEGRVVYNGEPVSVRQDAIRLELWQDGFELRREIPVHVHQDGTFAARLFDGEYKLVRKQNNGPWRNVTDTILVDLPRSESIDVPVEPFFVIENESMQLDGTTLTAHFDVEQVVETSEVERVALYVGSTRFVDSRYNVARAEQAIDNAAVSGALALSLDLADAFARDDQLFARIAVKTAGVEEMLYTPVQTLQHP